MPIEVFITEIADRRNKEEIEVTITYSSKEAIGNLVDCGIALRNRYNFKKPE